MWVCAPFTGRLIHVHISLAWSDTMFMRKHKVQIFKIDGINYQFCMLNFRLTYVHIKFSISFLILYLDNFFIKGSIKRHLNWIVLYKENYFFVLYINSLITLKTIWIICVWYSSLEYTEYWSLVSMYLNSVLHFCKS